MKLEMLSGNGKLIFGLGTGRCGTLSLSTVLDAQYQTNVTHEYGFRLPWNTNNYYLTITLDTIFKQHMGRFVGDVAFWYLPYTERILELFPDAKFICLKRDRQDTIDSQIRCGKTLGTNHFVDATSKHYDHERWPLGNIESRMYRSSFPQYDLPWKEALIKYHDDYYDRAEYFERIYPKNFKIFDMHATLNTEEGQKEMLQFSGVESEFILLGIRIYKEFTGDPNQFKGDK